MTSIVEPRPQATRRAKRKEEVRERILQAATRTFVEKGYHGASLQDIANEAGIQKSALYYYFPSKEFLCFEVFGHLGRGMLAGIEEIYAMDLPAREKLRRAMESHIEWAARQANSLTIFLREARYLSGAHLEEARAIRDRYESRFRQILAEAIQQEQIRPLDVKFVSIALLSMCNWLYRWYKPGGKSASEIASMFWDLVYEGLRLQPSEKQIQDPVSYPYI